MIKIAVVIPTRNRASDLAECLESISKQTLSMDEFEVLVFDNGSSDDTKSICDYWKKHISNFHYFYDETPGLHVGRNYGYLHTTTPYIVYADDDIIAKREWLKAIVDTFDSNNRIMMIGGNDIPMFLGNKPMWVNRLFFYDKSINAKLLTTYSCIEFGGNARQVDPCYVFGCNMAVRRELLDECKGFHPDGVPNTLLKYRGDGETYVSQTLMQSDGMAYFVPEASVYHKIPTSRLQKKYLYYISYRCGISYAYTQIRNRQELEYDAKNCKPYDDIRIKNVVSLKKNGTNAGIKFMLEQLDFDAELINWIMRENYLGDNARIPSL